MLSKIPGGIWSILLIIISALVAYYLNRTVPDVRYTLSEKIPISFLDPSGKLTETVQQLEVKNIGNAEAKRIVVKINGDITSYRIEKYSAADSVEIFEQNKPFEIDYPELPPSGGFKFVLKSPGNGIDYRDLAISHSAGTAQDALSARDSGASFLVTFGLVMIYVLLFANIFANFSFESWKSEKAREKVERILQEKKPWYAWRKDNSIVFKEIVGQNLQRDYFYSSSNVRETSAYEFLSSERPDHVREKEWDQVIEMSADRLRWTPLSRHNLVQK